MNVSSVLRLRLGFQEAYNRESVTMKLPLLLLATELDNIPESKAAFSPLLILERTSSTLKVICSFILLLLNGT